MGTRLTHVDEHGQARMVEVGRKEETLREAVATAEVTMAPATLEAIQTGGVPKGDVLAVARVAAILAAKRTPELIPLCHPIRLTSVGVEFEPAESPDSGSACLRVIVRARAMDRTGVEMEALVAASTAALTVYDMCKAVDRGMTIRRVRLEEKSGGASGRWQREKGPSPTR